MKIFFLGLFLSIALHSLLLLEYNSTSISTNLPIGRTIIGKVKLVSEPKPILINKGIKSTDKKSKMKSTKQVKASNEKISTFTNSTNHSLYLTYIRTLIEQNKEYPFTARKMNIEGTNEVLLNISKDGSYEYRLVVKASSNVLNNATNEIFKKIKKFRPLPEKKSKLEITIPVKYELTN